MLEGIGVDTPAVLGVAAGLGSSAAELRDESQWALTDLTRSATAAEPMRTAAALSGLSAALGGSVRGLLEATDLLARCVELSAQAYDSVDSAVVRPS